LYGDAFLRSVQQATAPRQRIASDATRAAHETAFTAAYRQYLRGVEERFQRENPTLYAGFLEERRRTRHAMTGGLFLASAETLARFDSEASRLEALAEFCQRRPGHGVLGFWEWDAQQNPHRFRPQGPALTGQAGAAAA
jgi:hypothetical protein